MSVLISTNYLTFSSPSVNLKFCSSSKNSCVYSIRAFTLWKGSTEQQCLLSPIVISIAAPISPYFSVLFSSCNSATNHWLNCHCKDFIMLSYELMNFISVINRSRLSKYKEKIWKLFYYISSNKNQFEVLFVTLFHYILLTISSFIVYFNCSII